MLILYYCLSIKEIFKRPLFKTHTGTLYFIRIFQTLTLFVSLSRVWEAPCLNEFHMLAPGLLSGKVLSRALFIFRALTEDIPEKNNNPEK